MTYCTYNLTIAIEYICKLSLLFVFSSDCNLLAAVSYGIISVCYWCCFASHIAGVHLEKNVKGRGEKWNVDDFGGEVYNEVYLAHINNARGSGGMSPRKILNFKPSEITEQGTQELGTQGLGTGELGT